MFVKVFSLSDDLSTLKALCLFQEASTLYVVLSLCNELWVRHKISPMKIVVTCCLNVALFQDFSRKTIINLI